MKKVNFVFAAMLSLTAFAFASNAQTTDYSGTWTLDATKSKLDERMRVESMTLTVAQTAKDISVTTETKRMPRPADAPAPPAGRDGGRGGMMGAGDGTTKYSLDGKETKIEIDGPMGKTPQVLTAKSEGGKLMLSKSSTVSSPMGEVTISTKEAWSMSGDGKTLTVVRDQTTPRGSTSSTMVFVKK